MSSKITTVAIIGAGCRGLTTYARYIKDHPDEAKLVAVAEPRDFFRNEAVSQHSIIPENVFTDWQDMLARAKLADVMIIATTERLHTGPAVMAAEKGYHILLEKPMASTPEECIQIVDAAKKHNIKLAVAHVLRYAPFYVKVKQIIDAGQIGDLCSIQHMEGIAWWHHAHSFVRGNFGNESRSSSLLLAKSCHDIDILRWWVGKPCVNVQSFGHLKHFRKECQPAGATSRCMDCPLADDGCPYSAKKFYFEKLKGDFAWPLAMVIDKPDEAALDKALREGPYGRCVYECDNDVMDSQVVNMEFEDAITASFTLSAFTPPGRKVRVMGSKGYLEGDDRIIRVLDFQTKEWTEYDVNALATDITGGHGGGDNALMRALFVAVSNNDPAAIRTGPDATLDSHLVVFAAETSRKEGRVVNMKEMYGG